MNRTGACLRVLGRGMVHGLAANGWCWAACTLGAFPIEAAPAAHRSSDDRRPRPGPVTEGARDQAWTWT